MAYEDFLLSSTSFLFLVCSGPHGSYSCHQQNQEDFTLADPRTPTGKMVAEGEYCPRWWSEIVLPPYSPRF